jgi:hypothetical protein
MQFAPSILACLLLVGCNPSDRSSKTSVGSSDQPDIHEVAKTYQSLRKMTPERVYVNPELAMLCRGATLADVESARKTFEPHANTAVIIYMNDLAAGVFGTPNPTYPVGSIIVKEKKAQGYWSTTQPGATTIPNDGVGGMIKRSPGFDPTHGNWEYFYFEDPTKVETGKMVSCIQCHSGAAGGDYIFGTWAHANDGK